MKRIGLLFACVAAAFVPLFFTGCETESSADVLLELTPRSATLKPKQSQVFTVTGGYDYRWTLSDDRLGSLNKRTGNQVIYTATSTNSGTQKLLVVSYIEGASGNAPTNAIDNSPTATAAAAEATITQNGTGTLLPPAPVTTLTVIPTTAILTPSSPTVTFVVAEGVAAIWRLQNGSLGDPNEQTGISFTYTGVSFPSNAVTQVIDVTIRPTGGSVLQKSVSVTQQAN